MPVARSSTGPAGAPAAARGDEAAPGVVAAARHQRVHEVVAPGDAREHRADQPRLRAARPGGGGGRRRVTARGR